VRPAGGSRVSRGARSGQDEGKIALLSSVGLHPNVRVVEFGCATGAFTRELAKAVGPSGLVHGIDPSAFNIARARELTRPDGLQNMLFAVASPARTGLAADSADLVVADHLLGRVSDPGEVVAEMVRVLRPGGTAAVFDDDEGLVVYEPEPPALTELRTLLARKRHESGEGLMVGRCLYRFLREAGLQEVTVVARTFNSTEMEPRERAQRMNHLAALAQTVDSLRETGAIPAADSARYHRALEEVASNPLEFIFVCGFFAHGTKPLRCA